MRDEKTGKGRIRSGNKNDQKTDQDDLDEQTQPVKDTRSTTSPDVGTNKKMSQAETLAKVYPARRRNGENEGKGAVSLNGAIVGEVVTFQAHLNGSGKVLSYDPQDPFAEVSTVAKVSGSAEGEMHEQASLGQIRTLLALAGNAGITSEILKEQLRTAFGSDTIETIRSWQALEMIVTLTRQAREHFQKEKENKSN